MNRKIYHKSKFNDAQFIDKSKIDIFLSHDSYGVRESFSIEKIELDDLKLPDNAIVWLWCTSNYIENNYELGTVKKINLLKNVSIKEIKSNAPIYFRVNVFHSNNPKLLASSTNIQPRKSTEEEGTTPLLRVVVVDNLGDRLWELNCDKDEQPTLCVNNDPNINMAQKLRDDWLVRSLILPEAVSQVFTILSQEDFFDPGAEWHSNWNKFAKKLGIDFENNAFDDITREIKEAVGMWCNQLSIRNHVIRYFEEDHHEL